MFGHFYLQRDAALQAATTDLAGPYADRERSAAQLEYARELLADVLNRAAALRALGNAWFLLDLDAQHHADQPGADMEADEALRGFGVAAREFFEGDCDEARIRGCRARLFADIGDDRVSSDLA